MLTYSEARNLSKARGTAANSTDASYTPRVPQTADPIATPTVAGYEGVQLVGASGIAPQCPQNILVMPYVLGANDNTFNIRVIGWTKAAGVGGAADLWIPCVLAEYLCTAGNCPGVAAAQVLNTEFFADTLSLVTNMGTDAQGTTKQSPADDTPGWFAVELNGCQRVEFAFLKGTGTSANALWRAF